MKRLAGQVFTLVESCAELVPHLHASGYIQMQPHPAELVLLYRPQQMLATKSSRKRARKHTCDGLRYLCSNHAGFLHKGILSVDLTVRMMAEANFVLSHPLTWESARRWTPPPPVEP